MITDPGYDAKNLSEYGKSIENIWFVLLKDIKVHRKRGLNCMLLESEMGQAITAREEFGRAVIDRTYQINL